jgi:hypothetical protein
MKATPRRTPSRRASSKAATAAPALAALLLALAMSAAAVTGTGNVGAQGAPAIGLDLDTAGNTATSLGPVDACTRVHAGDQFDVDVYVRDVPPLEGVQATVRYDPTLLRPVGREVDLFLATKPGSNVSAVEKPAQSPGAYLVAGFDFGADSAESGSGAAIRVTFEALTAGTSTLEASDVLMIDEGGAPVQPADATGRFTGTVTGGGIVAVDTTCDTEEPTPGASTTAAAPTFQPSRVPSTATPSADAPAATASGTPGSAAGPSTPGTAAAGQTAAAGATAAPTFRSDARGASTTPGAGGQPAAAEGARSEDAGGSSARRWWWALGLGALVAAAAASLVWRRMRGGRTG